MRMWFRLAAAGIVVILVAGLGQAASVSRQDRGSERYAYGSQRFTRLVADSYPSGSQEGAKEFYTWMSAAYSRSSARFPKSGALTLDQLLNSKRNYFAAMKDTNLRMRNEMAFAAWLHKLVKNVIPKFSLDRGFEFTNVVKLGERQCFLQSTLIAGMLQKAGIDAGVVMVYKNIAGEETNNGHAVTLVRLSNGQDLIVDASDPEPFARHQGLFARTGGYEYLTPVFARYSHRISYFKTAANGSSVSNAMVRTMDYDFIRSQFYYYRGERAVGGILAERPTKEGLALSEQQLKTSLRYCPQNPLAVYMLARVYALQGKEEQARLMIRNANMLYKRFGWVPQGAKDYLARIDRPKNPVPEASRGL